MKGLNKKKITKSHTTAIDAAEPILNNSLKSPYITKIVLGIIKKTKRNSPKRLKLKETNTGFEISVRGNLYIQTVFVFCDNKKAAKEFLLKDKKISKLFELTD